MAAGLSDIIKSLSLKELQEAARHYVDHQEKLPVLENFEKNCLEALEETAVELSDEDHQKLVILHSFYANYDHYAEYYNHYGDDANDTDDANNAKIQAKLARLIPIQPQVNSSSERAASNSTWQRAVVTATTLREIIFDSIAAEANKKQLDKENLIKILPRILTPNQTCSSELDDIKNDYAGRIPYDLLKLLNVLRHEVVLMANNMGIEFDEKIAGITILYESFVKSMKVKAEKMLDDVMNDTFFEELHKIMKLSKADKEFLTDDKIGALLTNSYMLMCCQYINPVMQDEVQKQHHQDTGIIVSCISRIYQYIQSGKKGQELVSSITETAQEELATNNEMIRRDTYAKAVQSLKDGLVKFYSLIQDEKYEAVQQVLSSISIPSRKDENYYLQTSALIYQL